MHVLDICACHGSHLPLLTDALMTCGKFKQHAAARVLVLVMQIAAQQLCASRLDHEQQQESAAAAVLTVQQQQQQQH